MMQSAFHPYVTTGFLTSVITLGVGVFVYFKNRRSPIHQAFLLFSISIWIWSFFTAFQGLQSDPGRALFWGRTCHIGAALIPVFFYYFTLKITGKKHPILLGGGYLAAFTMIVLIFTTPFFIPGERTDMGVRFITSGGPLYFLVIVFFTAYVLLALIHLGCEIHVSSGARKKHLEYFFLASLAGFGIGGFNFLPVYGITVFPFPYSPACGAIYSCVIAYAILRHKLFEIELIVKKGIIFGFLFGIVYLAVSGLILFAGSFLVQGSFPALSSISTALAMLLYEPLKQLVTRLTHHFLFQKKLPYTSLIHQLTDKLAEIRDTQMLAGEIAGFLTQEMALEWAGLYLRSEDGSCYKLKSQAVHTPLTELTGESEAIKLARSRKDPLILSPFDVEGDLFPESKAILRKDRIEAIVPVFVENTFHGVLLLGKKKSDDSFSAEDAALLKTLMDEIGMFFLSAQLIREVTRSNLKLGQQMKMTAVTQLSAGVHHEVRNPLQALSLTIQAVTQNIDQPERVIPTKTLGEWLDTQFNNMLNCITRIQNSLERFAKFARPEEDFELTELCLRDELEKFLTLMREGQKLDKIRVHNNVPDHLQVWGSEGILQEIFFNLFINAYDAMLGKGELFFSAAETKNTVEMRIKDTGPGIPGDILPNIFDRFFTTKQNQESVGIGLPITRHHAERLGGSIEAVPGTGNGAEFILKLRKIDGLSKAA